MQLSRLDTFFWVAGFAGHLTLLAILLLKRRVATFPIFTSLVTLDVLRTIALYLIHRNGDASTYFVVYWSVAVLDVILQLLVLYEAGRYIFRPVGPLAKSVRDVLVVLIAGSVLLGLLITFLSVPPSTTWRESLVIRGEFFSSVLMSELLTGMIVFSVRSGFPWKTHVARIVQGLGIFSLVGLLLQAAQNYYGVLPGTGKYFFLSHAQMATYLLCLGYWTVTLSVKEQEKQVMPEEMQRQISQIRENVLLTLHHLRGRAS